MCEDWKGNIWGNTTKLQNISNKILSGSRDIYYIANQKVKLHTHTFASIISTPFYSYNFVSIAPISAFIFL